MMRHFSEDDLIRFQFNLSDEQGDEISAHLAECEQCCGLLKQLKNTLSALDLLEEDINVSDELIRLAVEQAQRPLRRIPFPAGAAGWQGP